LRRSHFGRTNKGGEGSLKGHTERVRLGSRARPPRKKMLEIHKFSDIVTLRLNGKVGVLVCALDFKCV